ncbi:MAG: hypothetical protein JO249_12480 [Acidobacteria bacterium]|nr:hypothetical protein [Acidobacteriota bacterium]
MQKRITATTIAAALVGLIAGYCLRGAVLYVQQQREQAKVAAIMGGPATIRGPVPMGAAPAPPD